MQSVRIETPSSDYPAVCALVENNLTYPFPGFGNTFPNNEALIPHNGYRNLRPLELSKELALQVARLNHHAARLLPAANSLASINGYLARADFEATESAIAAHKADHGHSLVILKKELLLAVQRKNLSGLYKQVKSLTEDNENTAWAVLNHYLYDLLDPTNNSGRATRSWLGLTHKRMERGEWYARIIEDDVLTRSRTHAGLSSALLRASALSLLDLLLLVWRKRNVHPEIESLQKAFANLDGPLTDVLQTKFSKFDIRIPSAYWLSSKLPDDIEVHRMTHLFDDISTVAVWRRSMNSLIFSNAFESPSTKSNAEIRLDLAASAVAEFPRRCEEQIAGLLDWEKSLLVDGSELANQDLLRAVIVAESLRKIQREEGEHDARSIAHLIASTDDLHQYISQETLAALLDMQLAKRSSLLTFVLWETSYRRNRTQDNELDRRLAFMKLCEGRSGIQVVELIEQTASSGIETATLIARTCTRTFLERLYLIMSSVKEVLETRLAVCQWLEKFAEPGPDNLKEESEALERELANLEARSDLDSTRVHVDEDSMREWFNETQRGNTTRYIQTVLAEGPSASFASLLDTYSREKADQVEEDFSTDARIGSQYLLLGIADATIKSFLSDRTFGLDAYLSRRIRHGTLSGHVLTPVNRILKRLLEVRNLHERVRDERGLAGLDELVDECRRLLASELDHVRKDVIQLRSDAHPQGLVQADWRVASNVAHLDAMVSLVRSRILETHGVYDIFPDVYSLCWDCLGSSLAQLRLHMIRRFLPKIGTRLSRLYDALPLDEQKIAYPFLREIHSTLEARVQEVCGWFIRPVFRRDRYSLKVLTQSTLSIVRELDDRYKFTEGVAISDDITLSRGSFDVFGDVLYVLIGNAARHGKLDGHIVVSGSQSDGPESKVNLSVTSQVATPEAHEEAIRRIEFAIQSRERLAIDRAAVEEGFSGLMKLVGVLQRVRSPGVKFTLRTDDVELKITFELKLPAEITRERT
jgi:hypothetical protein